MTHRLGCWLANSALFFAVFLWMNVAQAAEAERPKTMIATALQAGAVMRNADGTFSVDLEIRLQNVGLETLVDVQIFSDLAADLAPATVASIGPIDASGALSLVSTTFDGVGDRYMLPGLERLQSDEEALVRYRLRFSANGNPGPFKVSAMGWAAGEVSGDDADDVSQDGIDPDPDTPGNLPIDNPDPHDDFEPTPLPLPSTDPDPGLGALLGTVFFDPNLDSSLNPSEQGLLGWLIQVFAGDGSLVAQATTDAQGNYEIDDLPAGDYLVRISHPESRATWLEEQISIVVNESVRLDLPVVSAGRVYDSVTRVLVPGVTLRLVNVVTGQALPNICLLAGQQNQTVGQDAAYRFDLRNGADPACPAGMTSYRIDIVDAPSEYLAAPSTRILPNSSALGLGLCGLDSNVAPPCVVQVNSLPPTGSQSSGYFLDINAALNDQTFANNHLPIDSLAALAEPGLISIEKTTSVRSVSVGDVVPYSVALRNETVADLLDVTLVDDLPPGFVLIADSVRVVRPGADGQFGSGDDVEELLPSAGNDPVLLGPLSLAAGEAVSVSYFARVGVGVVQGLYTNRVTAEQAGLAVSASASAIVQVSADPLFEQTTVIGKVFDDRDGDGWQDPALASGLVLSGGPFRTAISLPNIRGRKAPSDPPMRVQTVLPGRFDAPLVLRSAEGSFLTLGTDGELRQSPEGAMVEGRTGQRLTMRVVEDDGKSAVVVENLGIVERGIPGVRLASVDGLLIETDQHGRYHIADVDTGRTARGANFILKLDVASLPDGSTVNSENPRVVRLTPALMSAIDFSVGLPEPELLPAPSTQPAEVLEITTRAQRSDVRPVNFDTGKVQIPDSYADELKALLANYRGRDNLRLIFVGHADPRPLRGRLAREFRDNVGLSAARASEVAEFARGVLDVDPAVVTHEGRGALQPVASNATERGMAANRRVEIEIAWTETNEQRVRVTDDAAAPLIGEQEVAYAARQSLPPLRFASGSLELDPGSTGLVRKAIERYGKGAVRFEVVGHTDNEPLGEANLALHGTNAALSLARAQAVARALQTQFALPADAVSAKGRGELDPVADNSTEQGRAQNRRVEIALVTEQVERVERRWIAPLQTSRTAYLPHGGRIWATDQPLTVSPKLNVLASGELWVNADRRLVTPPSFKIFSNYNNFISRKELLIYDAADTDRTRALAVLPVGAGEEPIDLSASEHKALHSALRKRRTQTLTYVLRAYGTGAAVELYDETAPRLLEVQQTRGAVAGKTRTRKTKGEDVWGLDNLARQEIPVNGSQVRLHGIDIGEVYTLRVEDEEVPLNANGGFVWERQLPVGVHELRVDLVAPDGAVLERRIPVVVDGNYQFMVGLVNVAVGENNISGNLEPLSADDHFDESVFVDGRLAFYAKAKIRGRYLITAQLDSTEDELKNFGDNLRREDPRRLFRQLDPDRFYPVYGDDSTTTTDVDTQGAFYVRVDVDRSSLVWGNYNTGLTDTQFTQYNRSLYGAKLEYKSKRVTTHGEARRKLTVFGSEAQSSAASVTFRATGGSLYYLRHTDIVQGSEKVWIEVRRRDSEQVLEREILLEGRDYEIDDLQGRIVLARPLSQVVNDRGSAIVRSSPLEGDDVFLLADYEYVPQGFNAEDKTAGARAKVWLGDHVGVGVSKIVDERSGTDYDLQGVDVTLQAGQGTYIRAEYSESEARQSQASFVSADGGLSFVRRDLADGLGIEGDAKALEARINLAEYSDRVGGDIRAWWNDRDAGFSAGRLAQGLDTRDQGIDVHLEVGESVRIDASYNSLERQGIGKDTIGRLQVEADVGRWSAGVEARYEDVERSVAGGASVLSGTTGTGDALLVGARLGYELSEQTTVYAAGQTTTNETGAYEENDLLSIGINTALNERAAVSLEVSDGDRGSAVIAGVGFAATDGLQLNLSGGLGSGATSQFGTRYSYGEGSEIYGSYAIDPDRTDGPRDSLTLGQRRSFGNHLSIFSESQFGKDDQYSTTGHAFGVDYSGFQDWLLSASIQQSDNSNLLDDFERTAASIGARVERNGYRLATRIEYREDQAELLHTRQYLTSSTFGLRASDARRWLAKLNLSWTDDELGDSRQARFVEFDLGHAYRPVWSNRWNLLGKYSFLYDLPSLGQTDGAGSFFGLAGPGGLGVARSDQRAHIFALEALFAANPKWEFGAKLALKRGELRANRDRGPWETFGVQMGAMRARYHLTRRWDGLLEYRWLSDWDNKGTRHGAIAALYRHLGDHLKLGAGYNFAGFDDDLKFHDYDSHGWFIDLIGKY